MATLRRFAIAAVLACACAGEDAPFRPGIDGGSLPADGGSTSTDGGSAPDGGGGAPAAVLPTAPVDFGGVACGGSAPADRIVTFTNTGDAQLGWLAVVAPGGAFTLRGADETGTRAGSAAPGDAVSLSIGAQAVPASATAGSTRSGTLTLTTNVPGAAAVAIPLNITARGGTLAVSPAVSPGNPSNATFGQVTLGTASAPVVLGLANTGNAPVSVTVEPPSDPQFALAGADSALLIAGGDSNPSVSVVFTPARLGASTAVSTLAVTGALCGAGATAITYQGQGSAALVTSQPGAGGTLSFGSEPCGAGSVPGRDVTLSNAGNAAYAYAATLGAGAASPFVIVSGANGTVPPAAAAPGSATISVRPDLGSVTTPGTLSDTLTIAPVSGTGQTMTIGLSVLVTGAVLRWGDVPGAFQNAVSGGTAQSQAVAVANTGNAPANPVLSVSGQSASYGPFSVQTPLPVPVPGGTSATASIAFAPRAGDLDTDTAQLSMAAGAGDLLCGALPSAVSLSGTGRAAGLTVSAADLTFGTDGFVPCAPDGASAAAQNLVLGNSGGTALTWQATLGRTASTFTVSPSTGTLQPGDSQTVVVTPLPIPFPASTAPDAYGDVLSLTTSLAGDAGRTVALHLTARGAILSFQPAAPIDFGEVPLTTTASAGLSIANEGNIAAGATVTASTISGAGIFSVDSGTSRTLAVAAGATAALAAGYSPGNSATTSSGRLALTVDAATSLCAALPPPLELSGRGTQAKVTVNPPATVVFTGPPTTQTQNGRSVSFGAPPAGRTYCGTTAAPQTVTLGNVGSAAFTITDVSFGQGTASPYRATIDDCGQGRGVVPPGGTCTATIRSAAVPATYEFANPATDFADTVTLSTDAPGDVPHVLTISQSPWGAVLRAFAPSPNASGVANFVFNATPGGGQSSLPMGITNAGSAPATVGFEVTSSGNAPAGTWSFDTGTVEPFGALPGAMPFNAYFSPPRVTQFTTYTGATASFRPEDTPLCAPLPVRSAKMAGSATLAPPVRVAPTTIVLGPVDCGAQLPAGVLPGTVRITNGTGDALAWTASIPANANGTAFGLSPASGTVAAGATDSIVVTPAPVPPAADVATSGAQYQQTMQIAVGTGTDAQTFTVNVLESARGMALQWLNGNTSVTLPPGTAASPSLTDYRLQNFGNDSGGVTVTLATSNALLGIGAIGTMQASGVIPRLGQGGLVTGFPFQFANGNPRNTRATGTLTAATTGNLCRPLPAPLQVDTR